MHEFLAIFSPDDLCIGNFDLIMAFDLSSSANESEIASLSNYSQNIAERFDYFNIWKTFVCNAN